MNLNQLAAALKEEARTNPVAHAVFLVFAMRERARNEVTVTGLSARMSKEGFHFTDAEYAKVLRFLSTLGMGKLQTIGNKVVALNDVRITLQSIGAVAMGQKSSLTSFKPRNRFAKLVIDATEAAPKPLTTVVEAPKVVKDRRATDHTLTVTLQFEGKPVTIQMPKGTTAEDLAHVLVRLNEEASA